MKWLPMAALIFVAACSGTAPQPEATTITSTTGPPATVAASSPEASNMTPAPGPEASATSTTMATTTSLPDRLDVATPGTYSADRYRILLRFESRIEGVTADELADQALAILNDPRGWSGAGFDFAASESSDLAVILAEGPEVDQLCLPLETYGTVSCQNGPVVALNADRWRLGGDDWDGSLEAYRTYLVNHEVGHLIGLRHPVERCPTESKLAALMEPQTNNLQDCVGNGHPLPWELEWAREQVPAVIGPDPDWDGPRPSWPADG